MTPFTRVFGGFFVATIIVVPTWAVAPLLAQSTIDLLENAGLITGGRRDNEWIYLVELWGFRVAVLCVTWGIVAAFWNFR